MSQSEAIKVLFRKVLKKAQGMITPAEIDSGHLAHQVEEAHL